MNASRRTSSRAQKARIRAGNWARSSTTLTAGIVKLSKAFENEDLKQLSAIRLESLDNHWKFYQAELDDWRAELDSTTGSYTEDAAELAKRRVVWETTRDALTAGGVTPALIDRVNVIIGQITLAEKILSEPLDEQFKLRRRANTVQTSIDAGKKGVDAAIAYYDRRLGTIDAAPVWKAWDDSRFTGSELKGTAAGLRLETAFVEEWGAANQPRIQAYKIGALALLPLLPGSGGAAARRSRPRPPCRRPRKCCGARSRRGCCSSSSACRSSSRTRHSCCTRWRCCWHWFRCCACCRRRVFDVLGRWPLVGTSLYLLYRLSILLLGQPLYYRLYMLGIALVTAAVLVWLLVSSSRRHQRTGTPAPHGVVRALAGSRWLRCWRRSSLTSSATCRWPRC